MRIIIDTTKNRIIVPKSFFTELGKMNKILEEGGSTKKWTPEEYVHDGFSFKKIAEKLRRSPDTVSRYVHEYEAAVSAASVVLKAQNL